MIPITLSLCNNIIFGASLDTKDAHIAEKLKKKKKDNKFPIDVTRDSQQQEHHRW
jgi:hypothetical protein